jgi:hypothetical protein
MLPTMLWFIWPSDFRGKDFLEIDQSETRIACGGQWPFLLTAISKKSSSLKLLGQMNRNLVGSIYGKSSIKIDHFVPIC